MKMRRIPWREAVKRWKFHRCTGCAADLNLNDLFVNEFDIGPFCGGCATKLATAVDSAHSVNVFYSNTTGKLKEV